MSKNTYHRRNNLLMTLGIALLLAIPAWGQRQAQENPVSFYYVGDQKVQLDVVEDHLTVTFGNSLPEAAQEALDHVVANAQVRQVSNRLGEIKVGNGVARAHLNAIRNSQVFKSVDPLYSFHGKPVRLYGEVLVALSQGTDLTEVEDLSDELGADAPEEVAYLHGVYRIRLPQRRNYDVLDAVLRFHELASVRYVDPVIHYELVLAGDPYEGKQWAIESRGPSYNTCDVGIPDQDLDATVAWGVTKGSSAILVAVMDEGVDPFQEDLRNGFQDTGVFRGEDIYVQVTNPGCLDPPTDPCCVKGDNYELYTDGRNDCYPFVEDHGTQVAGIMAATHNDVGIKGIAPNVRYASLRIGCRSAGSVATSNDVLAAGVQWAIDNHVDIINCSWNIPDPGTPSNALVTNIDAAYRNGRDGRGIPVIFSAGNVPRTDDLTEYMMYPSTEPHTIAVGAMNPCGTRVRDIENPELCGEDVNALTPQYGRYGFQLDFQAPGLCIYTTGVNDPCGSFGTSVYIPEFGLTSAAAAMTTGTAALMMSADPYLPVDGIRGYLAWTASDVTEEITGGMDGTREGWDEKTGWGSIKAGAAVTQVASRSKHDVYVDCSNRNDLFPNQLIELGDDTCPFNTLEEGMLAIRVDEQGETSTVNLVEGTYRFTGSLIGDILPNPSAPHEPIVLKPAEGNQGLVRIVPAGASAPSCPASPRTECSPKYI